MMYYLFSNRHQNLSNELDNKYIFRNVDENNLIFMIYYNSDKLKLDFFYINLLYSTKQNNVS